MFLLASSVTHVIGCSVSRSYDPVVAARVRSRTTAEFALGVYYKPGDHAMTGLERELVPLIIDEATSKKPARDTLICTPAEQGICDSSGAAVYSATSTVSIVGQAYDQVLYVWFYHSIDAQVLGRGVRVVIGRDGFPMLWEALSPVDATRVFFVSRGLEEHAARQFGAVLPGRTFAIERSIQESPGVVVARILSDGPVPMGPWVYVGRSPAREIVTVLCRCMPSQVDEFVRTIKYDLQPFEAIPDGVYAEWLRGLTSGVVLTDLLRWPVDDAATSASANK
jgi:hypothetical protein